MIQTLQREERRAWLVDNIKGLGYKEASHFLRNIGFDDYAIIDSHILDLLERYNLIKQPKTLTRKKYTENRKHLTNTCNKNKSHSCRTRLIPLVHGNRKNIEIRTDMSTHVKYMDYEEIITKLHSLTNPENVKGMARYGINQHNNLGISIYVLRPLAKEIGTNHALALKLWDSQIHDARLLACFIDDPAQVTSEQMDAWAEDFDSWDICDQACTSLFDLSPLAYEKVFQWAGKEKEFVKRAAFSLIAGLAVHDKNATDQDFERLFPSLYQTFD